MTATPAARLRQLLAEPGLIVMPCCFDALSARLIERAGFPVTFMSGFAVSAARLAMPDTGLISYGEMLDQGRNICDAIEIPVIGDADTGYGNEMNARRTVRGYARAGFACLMIEDQQAPKRCGHTRGKQVIGREEARMRMRATLDGREALRDEGGDILVMARTDAAATLGLDEAIGRAQDFREMGADIAFVEAPRDAAELARIGSEIEGPKMANLVEGGDTPVLSPAELESLGFKLAAHPLTLLNAATTAMQTALQSLASSTTPPELVSFATLQSIVGFPDYDAQQAGYIPPGRDKLTE